MIRKQFLLPVLTAGAMMTAGQAQASVRLASTSGIVNQLHYNATFSGNTFSFRTCQGNNCQTVFTGVQGVRNLNSNASNLDSVNSWANSGSYGTSGYFDNYRFTFTGVGSYFGKQTSGPLPQDQPVSQFQTISEAVPEPGTWAMMILGFGLIGRSMRRRAATTNFA